MQPRSDLRPALAASVALHGAIVLAALIAVRLSPAAKPSPPVVPVTIVSTSPEANERPAVVSRQSQTAATPEPTPKVSPPVPAPAQAAPAPEPAPEPDPRLQPRPSPPLVRRIPVRPAPIEPEPARKVGLHRPPRPRPSPEPRSEPKPDPKPSPKPASDLDLAALSKAPRHSAATSLDLASLSASARSAAKPRRANLNLTALAATQGRAPKGAARAETDRAARQAVGAATALTGNQLAALKAKIIPLWHPICDVQGATSVVVKVEMHLDAAHQLASSPRLAGRSSAGASDDVVLASAQRALAAVAEAAPYDELPATAPRDFILSFNVRDACSGG